jgi:hypothetical protein
MMYRLGKKQLALIRVKLILWASGTVRDGSGLSLLTFELFETATVVLAAPHSTEALLYVSRKQAYLYSSRRKLLVAFEFVVASRILGRFTNWDYIERIIQD